MLKQSKRRVHPLLKKILDSPLWSEDAVIRLGCSATVHFSQTTLRSMVTACVRLDGFTRFLGPKYFRLFIPRSTFFLVGYSKWGWLASPFTLPGSAPASSSDHSDTAGDIHVVAQPVKITFKPLGLGRRTNMTKGRVMISLVLLLKHFGILE